MAHGVGPIADEEEINAPDPSPPGFVDVAGDEGVCAPGGGLDFSSVEEHPGPAGQAWAGFLGDGPVVVPTGAIPAHYLGDKILDGGWVSRLPGPMPERAQPRG